MKLKIPKANIEKIKIIKTDCRMTLEQMVKTYGCDYAINGGLYDMKTGKVNAIPLRIDGTTIATSSDGYWTMAWNNPSDLCMAHSKDLSKWQNMVACSTMLKDGQNTIFTYTSAQGGKRGRTAFGCDKDNVYLFVTTDSNGALTPNALREEMRAAGAQNAIMLDCGGSSQMYANGKYIYSQKRKVAYWIAVWLKKSSTGSNCPYTEPTTLVKSGSRGEGAKWVQWHLNKFQDSTIVVDGIFGTKSVTALKKFQSRAGLTADGICGAATRAAFKKMGS